MDNKSAGKNFLKGLILLLSLTAAGLACAFSIVLSVQDALAQQPQKQQDNQEFNYQRALQNLQAIKERRRSLEQLSPSEQAEVHVLARYLSRPKPPPGSSQECRQVWDRAASAAQDVSLYAGRLKRCVDANDFRDDCSIEFRRIKNAQSDYEDAVSDVSKECQ